MVSSYLSELSKKLSPPPADSLSSSLGAVQYVWEGVASSEVCQNTHSVRRVFSIVRFTPLQPNHNEIPIKITENGSGRKMTLVRAFVKFVTKLMFFLMKASLIDIINSPE